jgi:hypothetical protein
LKRKEVKNQRPEFTPLDEQASTYLNKNGATSVAQLYDALRIRNPSLSEMEMTDLVWRLVNGGKADVEDIPPPTESLGHYLRMWERNLWFYASVAISLMTAIAIFAIPSQLPLIALRWILGSVFVLFIPGYATVELLFPKSGELDEIERLALSVGLSLVLVMLVGFLLNYTPWGIRLVPIVISLTILTVGLAIAAFWRQFAISIETLRSETLT